MWQMTKTTTPTREKDIKRVWHFVNVKDAIVGRMATAIALKLVGKAKPDFVRHLDMGDYVVVINAQLVRVTGRKAKQKIYTTYSGYPGGLREESFESLQQRK